MRTAPVRLAYAVAPLRKPEATLARDLPTSAYGAKRTLVNRLAIIGSYRYLARARSAKRFKQTAINRCYRPAIPMCSDSYGVNPRK